ERDDAQRASRDVNHRDPPRDVGWATGRTRRVTRGGTGGARERRPPRSGAVGGASGAASATGAGPRAPRGTAVRRPHGPPRPGEGEGDDLPERGGEDRERRQDRQRVPVDRTGEAVQAMPSQARAQVDDGLEQEEGDAGERPKAR